MISKNLISAASFSPRLIHAPSAWLGHLPFAFWLVNEMSPKVFVELGTHYGHSYFAFCQAILENGIDCSCYAVDTWEGDEHAGHYDSTIFEYVSNQNESYFVELSKLLKMTFDEAQKSFGEETIDLLHIDGLHTYEAVKHDFYTWLPKLSPGAVVLFHDTNVRERDFGVWKLWEELKKTYPYNLEFTHSFGLGVLQLNNAAVDKRLPWLAPDFPGKKELVEYFSSIGSRQFERYFLAEIQRNAEPALNLLKVHSGELVKLGPLLKEKLDEVDLLREEIEKRKVQISGLKDDLKTRESRLDAIESQFLEVKGNLDCLENNLAQALSENKEIKQVLAGVNQDIRQARDRAAAAEQHIAALQNSTSWKLTMPARFLVHQTRRIRRAIELVKPAIRHGGGLGQTVGKAAKLYRRDGFSGLKEGFRAISNMRDSHITPSTYQVLTTKLGKDLQDVLPLRILVIAELSIPQCKKYRVEQKIEIIESLGVSCTALSWTETVQCLDALQTHSIVIFYRVPAFGSVLQIIDEAKRLGVPTVWEVDDFIFDKNILANSRTLASLSKDVFDQLVEGADLYRRAMLSCDEAIASTSGLAEAMSSAGVKKVYIVENALDKQTLKTAKTILEEKTDSNSHIVRIVYGSGTNTHNVDFEEAGAAILSVLEKHPNVRLRVIGALELSELFAKYRDQIELFPLCPYEQYLQLLAECDISIAPLENYIFNDAKSNIKYLEASIVQVPSVCSPRAAFSSAVSNGNDGFLCDSQSEWENALEMLIHDSQKRIEMGKLAYCKVMQSYSPENIATCQIEPFLNDHLSKSRALRILSVNCYYYPRSFGGATIVAEEVNKNLNSSSEIDIFVCTTLPSHAVSPYQIRRYEKDGINIYGIGLPNNLDERAQFENGEIVQPFSEVLAAVKPDIVHFHSIQGIGVAVIDLCQRLGIKYVVTLHDSWWLCGRHFMITKEGQYCGQTEIDINNCSKCVTDDKLNRYRNQRLKFALKGASALTAPSVFSQRLYENSGVSKVLLNKNGIMPPLRKTAKIRKDGPLRFGYVGGNTEIKGFHLIKKVFSHSFDDEASLIIVDNAINLGFTSFSPTDLQGVKNFAIIPAYTQDTIDEFFEKIDVLLFPTQCKESFGLTVREALARNVWVITTDAGGAVEDIEVGANGFVIPLHDDGSKLLEAVRSTLNYFDGIKTGETITLGKADIRFFEDQASELALILKDISNSEAPATSHAIYAQ